MFSVLDLRLGLCSRTTCANDHGNLFNYPQINEVGKCGFRSPCIQGTVSTCFKPLEAAEGCNFVQVAPGHFARLRVRLKI